MGDSRVQQFVPLKKVGTDISTKVANDAINADRFKGTINVETLAATRALLTTDYIAQWLDPNGADRNVTLPAEASSTNLLFIILNTADGAGEDLLVYDDTPTLIATLGPGMSGIFSCNGTAWKYENDSGVFYDAVSGNRGIGTATPNANAVLDVTSVTRAFMPPRMTSAQRDAIASPTAGMVIYNSTTNVLNFHNGTSWGGAGQPVIKTSAYNAVAGDSILADTNAIGAFTITLPAAANAGDIIQIYDAKGTFATANATVARNGLNIRGVAADLMLDVNWVYIKLIYVDASIGWRY